MLFLIDLKHNTVAHYHTILTIALLEEVSNSLPSEEARYREHGARIRAVFSHFDHKH